MSSEAPLRVLLAAAGIAGRAVMTRILSQRESYDLVWVWTTEAEASLPDGVAVLAEAAGVPVFLGNPRESVSETAVKARGTGVLVAVNYPYLLPAVLFRAPTVTALNVHGSLLPAFRGRTPNTWAIIEGALQAGVTCHVIDEGVDTGPVVVQEPIAIAACDTGWSLAERMIARMPDVVCEALARVRAERPPVPQQGGGLTYGRRRPHDGGIDWSWSAARIYDWVRAQTAPYPGAFTFCHQQRLLVWDVAVSRPAPGAGVADAGTIIGRAWSPRAGGVWVATGTEPVLITAAQFEDEPELCGHHLSDEYRLQDGVRLGSRELSSPTAPDGAHRG